MRFALLVAVIPSLLVAQESGLESWQKSNAAWVASYEKDHAKLVQNTEKALKELDRREDAWLSLARDFFGMTNNNLMDPDYYDRQRRTRHEYKVRDDSSATLLIAAARDGKPAATLQAMRDRAAVLNALMPENDSAAVFARTIIKYANIALEKVKSDDNPSNPPDIKQYIKKAVDYYEKLIRASRLRADFHEDMHKAWTADLRMLDAQGALAAAVLPKP